MGFRMIHGSMICHYFPVNTFVEKEINGKSLE